MLYNIGSTIDLTYINKKTVEAPKRKTFQETAETLVAIGTHYVFKTTPEGLKAAISVPVSFA